MKNRVFVRACELQEDCEGEKFSSFLIQPVQRLPRYRLLLETLQKYTEESHPDHLALETAIQKVSGVLTRLNEEIATRQLREQVVVIQDKFTSDVELVAPGRNFLKEGSLLKLSNKWGLHQEKYFVLFNDILVYGRRAITNGKIASNKTVSLEKCIIFVPIPTGCFFILVSPDRTLYLQTTSVEEREEWVGEFRKAFISLNQKAASVGKERDFELDVVDGRCGVREESELGPWMRRKIPLMAVSSDGNVAEYNYAVSDLVLNTYRGVFDYSQVMKLTALGQRGGGGGGSPSFNPSQSNSITTNSDNSFESGEEGEERKNSFDGVAPDDQAVGKSPSTLRKLLPIGRVQRHTHTSIRTNPIPLPSNFGGSGNIPEESDSQVEEEEENSSQRGESTTSISSTNSKKSSPPSSPRSIKIQINSNNNSTPPPTTSTSSLTPPPLVSSNSSNSSNTNHNSSKSQPNSNLTKKERKQRTPSPIRSTSSPPVVLNGTNNSREQGGKPPPKPSKPTSTTSPPQPDRSKSEDVPTQKKKQNAPLLLRRSRKGGKNASKKAPSKGHAKEGQIVNGKVVPSPPPKK